jgi:phosphonate transport system substrate-binding protein
MNRRQTIKQLSLILGVCAGPKLSATQRAPLHIGVVPHISARSIAYQYEPLQNYLTHISQSDVTVSSAADWQSFYRNAKADQYDIVIAPAHVARIFQVELVMKPVAAYHPRLKGILVTEKATGIDTPTQIRSRSVVSGNPASLVALEGESWLDQVHGIKKGVDYRCVNVRGDDSVGIAVLKGEGSAGLLCLNDFNAYPVQVKSQLTVLATYAEFPNFVILTNHRMNEQSASDVERRLLEFAKSTPDSASFEQRTGLKIIQKPELIELTKLDKSAARIRHLLG